MAVSRLCSATHGIYFGKSEISLSIGPKSVLYPPPSRPTHKGRFAIVTDVGQGMRWTQAALLTRALSCGRRSRVVLTPRRWRQARGAIRASEGGKKARSPGRARRKPLKPLRAGMPGDPGATVVTNARAFYTPRAAAGASGTRHSPRPLLGGSILHNSGASRRGMAEVYLSYPRRPRKRAIQYSDDRTEKLRRTGYSAFAEYDGFMRGLAEIRIRKPASTASP
jgi:hypothetical protein